MGSSEYVKVDAWPWSSVNVANFVSVRPSLWEKGTRNFSIWKEQMTCLLESEDVIGFVDGGIPPPPTKGDAVDVWRRRDRLVKGWILGSIRKDALDAVWEKQTARDVWLELDNIFSRREAAVDAGNHKSSAGADEDFMRYLPLYQATVRGDWDTASNFFQDVNDLTTTIISSNAETALHIAVSTGESNHDFVKKLVELTPAQTLGRKDRNGDTALHIAAAVGNQEAAIALVNKSPDLLYAFNNYGRLPVQRAAIRCKKETLKFLISKYEPNAEHNLFEGQLGIRLLIASIASQFLDVALDLVRKYPNLALLSSSSNGHSALSTIAELHTLFPRTECFSWWQKFVYHRIPIRKSNCEAAHTTSVGGRDIENLRSEGATHNNYSATSSKVISRGKYLSSIVKLYVPKVKELREKKAMHQQTLQLAEYLCHIMVSFSGNEAASIFRRSIITAAKNGISEIVEMILQNYPGGAFVVDDITGRNVFLLAASNRFENIINLIYNTSDRKYLFFDSTDKQMNNLMHICGYLAPPNRLNLVAGAALQMQRELQWFKEMENFVDPSRRIWPNSEWQTPQMLFTKEHEKLKADGERWMKETANACTIAAALITTVVFTAAFTVPGGYESNTGIPLFSSKYAFVLFGVSDAVSLFTSITSLLMFLSILTSRYAEEDFLHLLPMRLSIGLLSLFVSITFMMVAFCATLYLVFREKLPWMLLPVAAFACLPVATFVLLQFPLLVDVLYSTNGPGIFRNKTISNKQKRSRMSW